MLDLVAAFIALTTLLTYVNYRFIRLPPTIGVMATALVFSLIVQGLSELGYPILEVEMQEIIRRIDFSEVLMTWFLPALLFAGALHVDLSDLRSYKWPIGLLATAGVLIATFVIGGLAYYTFPLFGWQVDFIYCLLFGALISPTGPIAVLGILKSAGAPKPLATTIVGESLFNDGTAVVVFAIILGILQLGEAPTVSATAILFVQEAIGGVVFGAGARLRRVRDDARHRPVPGGGHADPRPGHRRCRAGRAPARIGADRDGGGRADHRQPRTPLRDVGRDPALRGQVLGTDRRDPQTPCCSP
ncbi:Na+/H+ antiporter [Pseudomonas aeruginosa]|nr:Na+/H+ antiporter [Pseudomonas aeruginosa]